jgi:hypothetical protein
MSDVGPYLELHQEIHEDLTTWLADHPDASDRSIERYIEESAPNYVPPYVADIVALAADPRSPSEWWTERPEYGGETPEQQFANWIQADAEETFHDTWLRWTRKHHDEEEEDEDA